MSSVKDVAKRYGRMPSEDDVYEVKYYGYGDGAYYFRNTDSYVVEFIEQTVDRADVHSELLRKAAHVLIRDKGLDEVYDGEGELIASYERGEKYQVDS